jgi:uncharacterized SAM-binding protein YcdF (DUF218 family)
MAKLLTICVTILTVAWLLLIAMAQALVVKQAPEQADAIVVFAGAGAYLERTNLAARFHAQGVAPKIILTDDELLGGWSPKHQRNLLFIEKAEQELERLGVPEANIKLVRSVVSGTYHETTRVRDFAQEHNLRSLMFITSAYHSRRALWTVRQVFSGSGIQVSVVSVPNEHRNCASSFLGICPSDGLMIPWEHVKLIYYWLQYRQ